MSDGHTDSAQLDLSLTAQKLEGARAAVAQITQSLNDCRNVAQQGVTNAEEALSHLTAAGSSPQREVGPAVQRAHKTLGDMLSVLAYLGGDLAPQAMSDLATAQDMAQQQAARLS